MMIDKRGTVTSINRYAYIHIVYCIHIHTYIHIYIYGCICTYECNCACPQSCIGHLNIVSGGSGQINKVKVASGQSTKWITRRAPKEWN